MHRFSIATLSMLAALMASGSVASAAPKAQNTARERLDVYSGVVSAAGLRELTALGIDRRELKLSRAGAARGKHAQFRVEAILSGRQADALEGKGVELAPKKIDGATAAQRATAQADAGLNVFRKYSGPGGLQEEFTQIAAQNPKITKLFNFGKTVNGQNILALKVSKDAKRAKDGKKPAVLYLGAQHAREWITPEMIRRLTHYFVDNYKTNSSIRRLVDANELWFVPVANPDGYDFTFQDGQRLWRKNLRDNNGDNQITAGDGVDLNRNLPTKWGYDNEGSSPEPTSETYRGPAPASEPETRALGDLARRVGFEFFVNYHSAAELLLYGLGWQVATPSPDDVLYEAMAGDDANPAVAGYDPDLSAELYTTNGDTDTDLQARFGTLGFTPEMTTCEVASAIDPDDEFEPGDCGSGFEFPDNEPLIQAEFEKNIPFALSVARSAKDPDDPVSAVGRTAENFRVDSFDVSYGDPQKVAVTVKRAVRLVTMQYRINGGRLRLALAPEWQGGERYGHENDDYYVERRGTVRGAHAGDKVEVWFSGVKPGGRRGFVQSQRFTYTVAEGHRRGRARDRQRGLHGRQPEPYAAGHGAPEVRRRARRRGAGGRPPGRRLGRRCAGRAARPRRSEPLQGGRLVPRRQPPHAGSRGRAHLDAVRPAARHRGRRAPAVPHDGRARLPQRGRQARSTTARRRSTRACRASATPSAASTTASTAIPAAECQVDSVPGFFEDCLILADDFRQYYLGAFVRTSIADPASVSRDRRRRSSGFSGALGGPVVTGDNPLDEAGFFQPTSDVLPPAAVPAVHEPRFGGVRGRRCQPVRAGRGQRATRPPPMPTTRTCGCRGRSTWPARRAAQLQFQLSLNSEQDYDQFIVEAHTVGMDNWTTLAEVGGATSTDRPAECSIPGFLVNLHPFLTHYFSGADCSGAGSSGAWNSITGSTGGWVPVAYDLTAFAGQQVEVSLTYVTDPNTGGVGAFVDDTRVVVDGVPSADGFEGQTSAWAVGAAPAGSPPPANNWVIGPKQVNAFAATSTDDTLLLGFGLEQLSTAAERNDLMDRALAGLLE